MIIVLLVFAGCIIGVIIGAVIEIYIDPYNEGVIPMIFAIILGALGAILGIYISDTLLKSDYFYDKTETITLNENDYYIEINNEEKSIVIDDIKYIPNVIRIFNNNDAYLLINYYTNNHNENNKKEEVILCVGNNNKNLYTVFVETDINFNNKENLTKIENQKEYKYCPRCEFEKENNDNYCGSCGYKY